MTESADIHAIDELSAEIDRRAYRERLDVFLASRDAGSKLTLDSLRAGIRLQTVIGAAADVARYADEAIAIIKEEYRPPLHCKEGCCYCCCKPGVLTSIPELLRSLVDLGGALNIALAAGDGFSEAVIDGGTALLPVENSSWVTELWALVRKTARQVGSRYDVQL